VFLHYSMKLESAKPKHLKDSKCNVDIPCFSCFRSSNFIVQGHSENVLKKKNQTDQKNQIKRIHVSNSNIGYVKIACFSTS